MNQTAEFLRKVQLELATYAAMNAAYNYWDGTEAKERMHQVWFDIPTKERTAYNQRVQIDGLRGLSAEELTNFGFVLFNELMLIPLWLYNYIADGQTLIRVDGTSVVKQHGKQDMGTKYGCVAFGFRPDVVVKQTDEPAPTVAVTSPVPSTTEDTQPVVKKSKYKYYPKKKKGVVDAKTEVPHPADIVVPEGGIVVPEHTPGEFVYKDE